MASVRFNHREFKTIVSRLSELHKELKYTSRRGKKTVQLLHYSKEISRSIVDISSINDW